MRDLITDRKDMWIGMTLFVGVNLISVGMGLIAGMGMAKEVTYRNGCVAMCERIGTRASLIDDATCYCENGVYYTVREGECGE